MTTVFSARGSADLAIADAFIVEPSYKKPLIGVGELAIADVICTEVDIKTNMSATGCLAIAAPTCQPAVKIPMRSIAFLGDANAYGYSSAKIPATAIGTIAVSDLVATPSQKTPIAATIPLGKADAEAEIAASHNVSGTAVVAKADAVLMKAYRKVEPPPPTFDALIQSPSGDVPLEGYKMAYGSSYRINLRIRGYFLSSLGELSGPEIRFEAKVWAGDNIPIFTKSTHQPVGGIGLTKVSTLKDDPTFGVLEEAIAQVRIYPEDTTLAERRSQQVWFEVYYVDPLSERPEPYRGSFSISI